LLLLLLLRLRHTPENYSAAHKWIKEYGTAGLAWYALANQQAAMLPQVHPPARNAAGRVKRSIKVNIDGVQFDKLRIRDEHAARYIHSVQERVGRLKAGWNKAAQVWGVRVANWVWKHGTQQGRATDSIMPDGTGYLEAVNAVEYADMKVGKLARLALRLAARNVDTKLRKALTKTAAKFNAAR